MKPLGKINSQKYFKKFFGIRIIKTAAATALAVFIAEALNLNMPLMAGFSAIVSMTNSVFDSYKVAFNRLMATIVGVIIASFFQFIGLNNFIGIFFGCIIIINLLIYLKWDKSINLALIVFLVLILYDTAVNETHYLVYGLYRIFDTLIGLIVGFFFNYLVFPPNRLTFLLNSYEKSFEELLSALENFFSGRGPFDIARLVKDIGNISSELNSLKNDKKLGRTKEVKISDVSNINLKFYTAFGILTSFYEGETIPEISRENKERLYRVCGNRFEIEEISCDQEFTSAFNFYLDELLGLIEDIEASIEGVQEQLREINKKETF